MLTTGVRKRVLNNGLTVLLKENRSWPVVAIVTYVKAGYFNEPDHLVGISHMIEHMFFKGTERRGVGQIAAATKSLGGYLNASTIYDHTLYYTVLPSKHLTQGLEIQSDAIMNTLFDPEELRKETEVVIQEAKRKLDMPTPVARENLFKLAFDKHRIRRWRIGTEEGLRALTREDYVRFYTDLYRPENIILAVVGDLQVGEAELLVEQYYGNFDPGLVKKEESPPEPTQREFKYRFLTGGIQQAQLTIGFRAAEIFHPDSYALEILASLFGRGRSSCLYQKVKEDLDLVNSISCSNYALHDLGIFMIEANLAPDKLRDTEDAIFTEIGRITRTCFSEEDLDKARTITESAYLSGLESVSGQANILAEFEALGDFRLTEEYLEKLYGVTADDVIRVAEKYFLPTNCSLLEYVPASVNIASSDAPTISAAFQETLNGKSRANGSRQSNGSADAHVPLMLLSGNGAVKEISCHRLENGLRVMIKENHQLPLVSAGVFVRGGRTNENTHNAGITSLSLRTSLKGTQTQNASEIALGSEKLGSSLHFSNDPDYMSFSMNLLSKNLKAGFDILGDVVTAPIFPEAELLKEKNDILAMQLRERDDMLRYPLKIFYSALFGDHPYGLSPIGEDASIRALDRHAVSHWYFEQLNPEDVLIVLVGDTDASAALDLVNNRFGSLRSNGRARNSRSDRNLATEFVEQAEQSDKEQTALVLGFEAPSYLEEDYYSLTVLQNVLSGLGGRLFEELRGRQSLAYTVTTFLVSRLEGGAFVSYIATSPDKEVVAKQGLLDEFEKLQNAPISYKELDSAIQYTIGTHQIGLETNRAQMQQYAHNEMLGKDLQEIEAFPEQINKVTADSILQATNKYFDLDRYAIGLVRGKSIRS